MEVEVTAAGQACDQTVVRTSLRPNGARLLSSLLPREQFEGSPFWMRFFAGTSPLIRGSALSRRLCSHGQDQSITEGATARLWHGGPILRLSRGDVVDWHGDVLVNCANETLSGSSGRANAWHFAGKRNVDTAVHRLGGPGLLEECQRIEPDPFLGFRCHAGDAVITNAHGKLRVKYVVHAVGPYFFGGNTTNIANPSEEVRVLASAYRKSLERARSVSAESICFPAIACGVRGCPHPVGAHVALTAVSSALEEGATIGHPGSLPDSPSAFRSRRDIRPATSSLLKQVDFVLSSLDALRVWTSELQSLGEQRGWEMQKQVDTHARAQDMHA